MNIGILEPDSFSEKALEALRRIGSVTLRGRMDPEEFVSGKNVLFVRLNINMDRKLLRKAEDLKVICSPTTGLNHIDESYCEERRIKIVSLRSEVDFLQTIRATPEHTLGLIIALKRNYRTAFLNSENPLWDRDKCRGFEIYKSRVGIIGLGRVGNILATFLHAMGADVSYCDVDISRENRTFRRHESIISLIEDSDTVVLCCNYTPGMCALIGRREIDMMEGKYFVNTARAELTDEDYLLEKAICGFFKGVAIDVLKNEQSRHNNLAKALKVADKANLILTPHIGGATFSSMHRTEEFVSERLVSLVLRGEC